MSFRSISKFHLWILFLLRAFRAIELQTTLIVHRFTNHDYQRGLPVRVLTQTGLIISGYSFALFIALWHVQFVIAESYTSYRDLSNAGVDFYGQGRELGEPDHLKAVRIGLLAPRTPEGKQLQHGVALAIEEANAKGGYHGVPYAVIFRPDDGPWGIAAKQVVRLTYDDEVWAILGGLDGLRTHLAELISAKAWIPIVTPTANDLTIDYANVPWVFRCMPDDGRQARLLLRYARARGYKRLVALTEGERESYTAFWRLREAAKRERYSLAMHLEYIPHNPAAILSRLKGVSMGAILIWGRPDTVIPLLSALRETGITVPVLLPAILATPEILEKSNIVGEIIVAAPYDLSRNDKPLLTFQQKYQKRTGTPPSPIALFAYDATNILIKAIESAGLNRAKIRDELSQISFDGLAGKIRFDSLGGNQTEPVLMTLRSGKWTRQEYRKAKSPACTSPADRSD